MDTSLAVSMLVLGLVHGLGPDHCAAMTALAAAGSGRASLLRLGARFGLGHALTLGTGALVVSALGRAVPASFERAGELLGGATLIVLGVVVAAMALTAHDHEHLHATDQPHTHKRWTFTLGALFGFSGLRALMLALPAILAGSFAGAAAAVACFGAGVVVSMAAFGLLAGHALSHARRIQRHGRALSAALGVAVAALGVYWVGAHY